MLWLIKQFVEDDWYGHHNIVFALNGTEDEVKAYVEKLNIGVIDHKYGRYSYTLCDANEKFLDEVVKEHVEILEDKIKSCKTGIESCTKGIDILLKVKLLCDDLLTDKIPKEMPMDELIKRIQGSDLPLYVTKFVNRHEIHVYDTNGNVEDEYGENFCSGSGLTVHSEEFVLPTGGFRYVNKYDIDDDLSNCRRWLAEYEGDYAEYTKQLDRVKKEFSLENSEIK